MSEQSFFSAWLASESKDGDAIKVKKIYIGICGGNLHAGVLFSQIMYWHGISEKTGKPRMTIFREGQYWLAKSYDDWWNECCVKSDTARKIIDRMVQSGLLIKRVWKFKGTPTVHIRIDKDRFEKLIKEHTQREALNRDALPDQGGASYQNQPVQNTISLTETTAETPSNSSDGFLERKPSERKKDAMRRNSASHELGGVSARDADPASEYSALERLLLTKLNVSHLWDDQRKRLHEPVWIEGEYGTDTTHPSPIQLYDEDPRFRAFVEVKVARVIKASEGKVGVKNLVSTIRNYGHERGWLAYQRQDRQPERSEAKPHEYQTFGTSAYIPRARDVATPYVAAPQQDSLAQSIDDDDDYEYE